MESDQVVSEYVALEEYQKFRDMLETANTFSIGVAAFCKNVGKLNSMETAVLQNSASAISILLSVNHLVQYGYLLSSKILLRSVIDRISTIAWLQSNGENGLAVWARGWNYNDKERPKTMDQKLKCFHDFNIFGENETETFSDLLAKGYISILNGDVHGDLYSALGNSRADAGKGTELAAGPNPFDKKECVSVCKLSTALAAQLMHEIMFACPRLLNKKAA
jgi:hypothetical protein